jgi:hypothetical protein
MGGMPLNAPETGVDDQLLLQGRPWVSSGVDTKRAPPKDGARSARIQFSEENHG